MSVESDFHGDDISKTCTSGSQLLTPLTFIVHSTQDIKSKGQNEFNLGDTAEKNVRFKVEVIYKGLVIPWGGGKMLPRITRYPIALSSDKRALSIRPPPGIRATEPAPTMVGAVWVARIHGPDGE